MYGNLKALDQNSIYNEFNQDIGLSDSLNDNTLAYLTRVKIANPDAYHAIINEFKQKINVPNRNLFLKAHHIDAVVRMLEAQSLLEPDILKNLEQYLQSNSINLEQGIREIRLNHLSHIKEQADIQKLMHHTDAHRLEIKVRAMKLINDKMHYFSEDNATDSFLHEIVRFSIEFHDYYQRNPGNFSTVEERTADQITQWIIQDLLSNPPEPIVNLVRFVIDHIVVLGTTMIFSPYSTIDLIELFYFFEQYTPQTDSNHKEFLLKLKHISLITSICDKFPAASEELVNQQLKHANSLKALESYLGNDIIIKKLASQLISYHYVEPNLQLQSNTTQAFLMSIVAHVCMRIELGFINTPQTEEEQASNNDLLTLMHFIKDCQTERAQHLLLNDEVNDITLDRSIKDFQDFYLTSFEQREIYRIMSSVFFNNIDKEVNFVLSQISTVEFCGRELPTLKINHHVPQIDADNLQKLKTFYWQLSPDEQILLCKELTLNTILQAGHFFYASHPHSVDQMTKQHAHSSQELNTKILASNSSQYDSQKHDAYFFQSFTRSDSFGLFAQKPALSMIGLPKIITEDEDKAESHTPS